jgi:AraC family chitin signaling transcriptional activator
MITPRYKTLFLSFLFLVKFSFVAQELPPINVFSTKDYGAENQNWAISQADNEFIYIANNQGLLEFNGARWQLYPTPNKTIMRSVNVFGEKIFTGSYMDFGFWQKNSFGALEFSSIVKEQNITMIEDEQIWNILEIDGWILFKSLERIYLYNLESKLIKIINAENKINTLSKVEGVIYFQERNKGVFKIENGVPKLISEHQILKENIIVDIYKKDNQLLFLTQEKGFYLLNDSALVPWKTASDGVLKGKTIYSAKQLKNKDFVLGTISNGVLYLNNDGSLNYQITHNSGLSNNTVLAVFEDVNNNLWLGLDNGVNCINNTSPFKMFSTKAQFLGTIYTSIVYDDMLYLGTNQGLFCKKIGTDEPFDFVEKTQGQVWNLVEIDNTLFCGHDSGTFYIVNKKGIQISNSRGTWDIKQLDENTIIQGSYDGLYVLKKTNAVWKVNHKIEGFNKSSRYFVIVAKDKVFVNHEYTGVFKLNIDANFENVVKVKKDESVGKGIYSSLIKYKDKIFYTNKKGVYSYKKKTDVFVKDTVYSQLIDQDSFTSAKLIYNPINDKLWSFSKHNIKYLTPGKLSNKPIITSIPLIESLRKGASGYENIIHLQNKKQLIGASNGYITVDLNYVEEPKDFSISIDEIQSFELEQPIHKVHLSKKIALKNQENNIKIFYAVANYNKIADTKYQYQLLGQNKQWSAPLIASSMLFENMPYGDYTFKVRGIVGGKLSKNIASFSFTILRPWYLSTIMLVVYVLLLLLLLFILHLGSKKYYKRQRVKLLEKAQKESELKELESSQEIIKLNNEKLRSDIESKNRELATSTMNIIKKNEFLSTIKVELVNGGDKNISNVVKIIDKNLNNTDDWKMFQEAFNNADKKFLRKVKAKHPDLTPNDLRLCAYLRLNLSSKEIAPLLNISPRSVEVKRYRLRKKMALPHDSNLTNYILEI